MATFNINAVDRRIQYTSTGQTAFNFSFQVNASSELQVYIDDTLKTETTHYSVSLNTDGTGTVTFNSATTSGEIITIIGDQPLSRTTVFQTGQANDPATLETEFDNVLIRQQQLKEITDRSIQLKVTTPRTVTGSGTSGPLEFPYDATTSNNAKKVISYNSAGTSLELGPTTDNLDTLATLTTEIAALGAITSNITTVAGMSSSNIATVAGKATEIGLLGNADVIADMALLANADVIADMNTLATTDIVSDLNTLATSDIVSDLNQLATTDFVSDLNAVEGIKANVTTVANAISNINSVTANATNINTVAADLGGSNNIGAVGGAIANVNTVATNLSGINSFAERYRVLSSDPSSNNDAGDLIFNTTGNVLKFFDGSAFQQITAGGITDIAQDSTPQLGGNLDLNGNDITGTGGIPSANLTGTIAEARLPSAALGAVWESKNSNFTAEARKNYFIDTSSNTVTATLPTTGTLGDEIHFLDVSGTFDTNNLTVGRNSHKIQGAASDLTVDTERAGFSLVYYNATQGWLLKDV